MTKFIDLTKYVTNKKIIKLKSFYVPISRIIYFGELPDKTVDIAIMLPYFGEKSKLKPAYFIAKNSILKELLNE